MDHAAHNPGHIPEGSYYSPRANVTETSRASTPTPTRLGAAPRKRTYPPTPRKRHQGYSVVAGGVGKRRLRISKIGSRIQYQLGATSPAQRPAGTQADVETLLHPLESQAPGALGRTCSDPQLEALRLSEYGEHRTLFQAPTKKRLEDYLSPRHRKTCGKGIEMELAMMMSSTHLKL